MATDGRESVESHEDMRRRLDESRSLQRVTAGLLQRLTLDEVLAMVRQEARDVTGAQGGSVFLLEDEAWLREAGDDVELDPLSQRIPVSGTLTGKRCAVADQCWSMTIPPAWPRRAPRAARQTLCWRCLCRSKAPRSAQ